LFLILIPSHPYFILKFLSLESPYVNRIKSLLSGIPLNKSNTLLFLWAEPTATAAHAPPLLLPAGPHVAVPCLTDRRPSPLCRRVCRRHWTPPPSHASPRHVAATRRPAPFHSRPPAPFPLPCHRAAIKGLHRCHRASALFSPPPLSSLNSAPRAKLLPVAFLTAPPLECRPSPRIRPRHRCRPLSDVRAAAVRSPPHFPHWGSASPLPPTAGRQHGRGGPASPV
jgi:hypothetical protein